VDVIMMRQADLSVSSVSLLEWK